MTSLRASFIALAALVSVLAATNVAEATHFRYGNITWRVPDAAGAPTTVEFTVTVAFRADASAGLKQTTLQFGDTTDNGSQAGVVIGSGVDSRGNAYEVRQYTATHTYATAGTFTAFFDNCCRVAGLENGAGDDYRVQTIVSLEAGNTAGPVSSSPAIIQLQVGGTRTYTFPAADADGDPITCRFGTGMETGLPAGDEVPEVPADGSMPTISTTPGGCTITWDLAAAEVGQQYVLHIVLESEHGGATSTTAIDLIVEVVLPPPPTCTGGGRFIAEAGQPFAANTIGTWTTTTGTPPMPTVGTVSTIGAPVGSTLTPPSGSMSAPPFPATFAWTPGVLDQGTTRIVQVNYTTTVPTVDGDVELTGTCFLTVQVAACPEFGDACTVGQGECAASGTNVCASLGVTVCNAMPGTPSPEMCDNLDNDCDGTPDNGNPGGGLLCDSGEDGVCMAGTSECQAGGNLVCNANATPGSMSETCNGLDDDCDGMDDEMNADCMGDTPLCNGAGGCVECLGAGDCDDSIECTTNACVGNACVFQPVAAGTMCSAGVCDGGGLPSSCVPCIDDTSGGTDSGCMDAAPACVTPAGGGAPGCTTCEDTMTGAGQDNGCDAATPVCDESMAPRMCFECLINDHCPTGSICGPARSCVPGCDDNADCAATPETPVCDPEAMACVECNEDSECSGIEMCDVATHTCEQPDTDGDGVPDDIDLDDDNDGIPDVDELGGDDLSDDDDGDGVPDYLDADSGCPDADADGRCDSLSMDIDFDQDGVPNHLDLDADGDGIPDVVEGGGVDSNGDGVVDDFTDVNGDGLHDPLALEPLPLPDTDTDDAPDFLDLDSDSDGVPDSTEGHDADHDGVPDATPSGSDTDGDGIDDAFDGDCAAAADCGGVIGVPAPLPDTDDDQVPDYRDADDDDDGVPTRDEDRNSNDNWADDDLDDDGIPDYLDPTDDTPVDAGMPDAGPRDAGPFLGDASPADAGPEGPVPPGGFAGGACNCSSVGQSSSSSGGLWLLGLLLGVLAWRRRRRPFGSAPAALAVGVVALISLAPSASQAQQGFTLDQFRMAETGIDGFAISRPNDHGHLNVGARLSLDYAHDPLVYEQVLGDGTTQARAIISDQLVGNVAVSLSLIDRLVIYIGLPVTLWSDGPGGAGWPTVDGTAVGDPYLGLRARIYGEEDDVFSLGAQVTLSAPLASAAQDSQGFSGERNFAFLPRLMGEIRAGDRVRIGMNVGARIRESATVFNLNIGQELTFGLGVTVIAVPDLLDIHLEGYGATAFENFFGREETPFEAIVGARVHPVCGLSLGLAGGTGLVRGYGSPNFRGVFEVSYTYEDRCNAAPVEEEAAPVPGDSDGDGLLDSEDQCPNEPEDADTFEDEDGCPDPDNDADGVPDVDDGAPLEPEDHDGFEDEDGVPDADNDADGLPDADDACPNEAEDMDGIQDEDGCPETDADNDSILDPDDHCPLTPGVPNPDNPACQGCPALACVSESGGSIQILDQVYFATNDDVILDRSFPVLTAVQSILTTNPQMRRLRVEGHTDSRGRDASNLELSRRRARSVRRWLIEHGIAADRLESWGCGETNPVDSNRTRAGRQANRRVEFHITDPEPDGGARQLEGCVEAGGE